MESEHRKWRIIGEARRTKERPKFQTQISADASERQQLVGEEKASARTSLTIASATKRSRERCAVPNSGAGPSACSASCLRTETPSAWRRASGSRHRRRMQPSSKAYQTRSAASALASVSSVIGRSGCPVSDRSHARKPDCGDRGGSSVGVTQVTKALETPAVYRRDAGAGRPGPERRSARQRRPADRGGRKKTETPLLPRDPNAAVQSRLLRDCCLLRNPSISRGPNPQSDTMSRVKLRNGCAGMPALTM